MRQPSLRRSVRAGVALLTLLTAAVAASPAVAAPVPAETAPSADLRVELTASTTIIRPERAQVVLDIAVDNIGAAPADDVRLALKLPSGGFIGGEPSWPWQCDYTTHVCVVTDGPLPAGGAAPLNLHLELPVANEGATATLGATVSTSSTEATTRNNSDTAKTTYAEISDLSLFPGEYDIALPLEGGPVQPTFRAENRGTEAAEDVKLVVDLPAGVTLDGTPGETWFPEPWRCGVTGARVECTLSRLVPGESSSVAIPARVGPGTADETFAIRGSVTTASPEWQTDLSNQAEVTYRYAAPPVEPADIAVTNVVLLDEEVGPGDAVEIGVVVENLADGPARDVRVRLALAPTVRPTEGGAGGTDWACQSGQDAETGVWYWECAHPSVERYQYHYLPLSVTFGAGTPAGQFVATATVTSNNDDVNQANNSRQAATTYRPQGTITGTAWYDEDRDGQRDAGERPVTYDPEVNPLTFIPEGGDWVGAPTTSVSTADGTYTRALAPGRYVVRAGLRYGWTVTTPDVGDDATDSDFTLVPSSPYNAPYAESVVVEVTDGGAVTLDVGVVPTA
ncbi:SdrD B-like domain-containing protein [Micromonospora thermarum]|uniref:DUF11 domain-containing protein n=1 Tax=Micromonospora thermarum TaxID=2720024 RepID=A0ABX0Z4Q1_9ACTN|nr:SdrD B-like domain-containing protein [Micromonospora thermarum]NJP31186.1 hypothetical protein [Micromonospora thermarum]